MFPDIAKGKKKAGVPINEEMIKEWSEIRK